MPSLRHQFLASVLPRLRRAGEVGEPEAERQKVLARKQAKLAGGGSSLPTWAVPRFERRFSLVTEEVEGATGSFAAYTLAPRGVETTRTLLYLHGGGYVYPTDPFQVRYAARLATELGARVVVPDYPTAPEATWRESHEGLLELAARLLTGPRPVTLVGDSAGGGLALALAASLRDLGGTQPDKLLLHAPWVDLTMSAPDTAWFAERDPWLFPGKAKVWAGWWAGSPDDLRRPEVSPGLGDLDGLPPTLMFCGTRDMLAAGCRALADRACVADWELTYVERPDLIHVFGILPGIPEARTARRLAVEFLR